MSPKINALLAEQHANDLIRSAGRSGLSVPALQRLLASARHPRV